MKEPRPTTKCRRCRAMHLIHQGDGHLCPDGSGRTFLRHTERLAVVRFPYRELQTLETVLRNALNRGGNAHELIALLGKVRGMRERMERSGTREAKAS